MTSWVRRAVAVVAAMSLMSPGQALVFAQQQDQNGPPGGYVIHANAELVLTNVVARDAKTGEVVRDLKQSDFAVFENGKKQEIASFDFQSVEMATPLNEATVSGLAAGNAGNKAVAVAKPEELRNHRLIVFFFDLTSMQPEDLDRSVDAARDFLKKKMSPADLIALVSLGNTLKVDQDFTADKDALIAEVGIYNGTEGQGFAAARRLTRIRRKIQRAIRRTRASTTTSIRTASCLRCGRWRSRSKRSRRRNRCCIFRAGFRATGLRTRRRCVQR